MEKKTLFFMIVVSTIFALVLMNNMGWNNIFRKEVWNIKDTIKTQPGKQMHMCPLFSNNLSNNIDIDIKKLNSTTYANAEFVKLGGWYKPIYCEPRHRVAIIVPYRNREENLKIFLRYMHPYLQRKQLEYRIFVIEQTQDGQFNRAMMMNTGFLYANEVCNYDCFIFHDVDLLPENDGIPYTCENSPVHMSVAIDKFHYRLPYEAFIGGVTALSTKHFRKVNGFSNLYFEWGGEDDDKFARIKLSALNITRPPQHIARYKALSHQKAEKNQHRYLLLETIEARYKTDGLNNLKSHVVKVELKRLFTWILVRVNQTEVIDNEPIYKQPPIMKFSEEQKIKKRLQRWFRALRKTDAT